MIRMMVLADDDIDDHFDQDKINCCNDKDEEEQDDASLDVSHSQGFGLRL